MKAFPLAIALYGALSCALPLIHEVDQIGEADLDFDKIHIENLYPDSASTLSIRNKGNSDIPAYKTQRTQERSGLKVTGGLDSNTLDEMRKPRCGVPDIEKYSTFPGDPRWKTRRLTYRLLNYTSDMSPADVDDAIERAWKVWSDVTPLTFTRVYDEPAHIEISFVPRFHSDKIPFDGPGKYLAHATAPTLEAFVHFDEDETWTQDLTGINLFLVAAHEFGHSLGLHHSEFQDALMFERYQETDPHNFKLHPDDIEGIQFLYGSPENGEDVETSSGDSESSTDAPSKETCDPPLAFDAVTSLRGETIFFKDSFFWRRIPQRRDVEKVPISAFWPALNKGIDAAYEYKDDDTVFIFKGHRYWATKGNIIQRGFPKYIHSLGLPKSIKTIDAAAHDSNSKKTYFFSGSHYWRYDEANKSMDKGYPRKISTDFHPVDSKVDAAFLNDERFYLFTGLDQYEFDRETKRILGFKKSNSWLECK